MTATFENPPLDVDEINVPQYPTEVDGTRINVIWLGEAAEMAFVVGHDLDEETFRLALARSICEVDDYYADGDVERGWVVCRPHMPDCREGTGRMGDLEPEEVCDCGQDWTWWGTKAKADDEGAVAVTWWSA